MTSRCIFLGLCLTVSHLSFAQATLTGDNYNPQPGESNLTATGDTTNIVQGSAGANITWDESLLTTPYDIYTTGVYDCSSSPSSYPCSYFGNTNIVSEQYNSFFIYHIADDAKLTYNGYHESTQTLDIFDAYYSDPQDLFRYPYTYGSFFTDTTSGYRVHQYEDTTFERDYDSVFCDGYGTLLMPGSLVYDNVLRTHRIRYLHDSILSAWGPTYVTNTRGDEYEWEMPGYHFPLLNIGFYKSLLTGSTSKFVSYAAPAPEAIEILGNSKGFGIYPNPAANEVCVSFNTVGDKPVRVSLLNMAGQEITLPDNNQISNENHTISYSLAAISAGVYAMRITTGNMVTTHKLVVCK